MTFFTLKSIFYYYFVVNTYFSEYRSSYGEHWDCKFNSFAVILLPKQANTYSIQRKGPHPASESLDGPPIRLPTTDQRLLSLSDSFTRSLNKRCGLGTLGLSWTGNVCNHVFRLYSQVFYFLGEFRSFHLPSIWLVLTVQKCNMITTAKVLLAFLCHLQEEGEGAVFLLHEGLWWLLQSPESIRRD